MHAPTPQRGEVATLMLRAGGWVRVAEAAGFIVEARFEEVVGRAVAGEPPCFRIVETRTRAVTAPHYSAMAAKP